MNAFATMTAGICLAAVALIVFGVLLTRSLKVSLTLPSRPPAPQWRVWDEELEEFLSETEVAMLRDGASAAKRRADV